MLECLSMYPEQMLESLSMYPEQMLEWLSMYPEQMLECLSMYPEQMLVCLSMYPEQMLECLSMYPEQMLELFRAVYFHRIVTMTAPSHAWTTASCTGWEATAAKPGATPSLGMTSLTGCVGASLIIISLIENYHLTVYLAFP